jgi:DNA-binding NtrC family response regulator
MKASKVKVAREGRQNDSGAKSHGHPKLTHAPSVSSVFRVMDAAKQRRAEHRRRARRASTQAARLLGIERNTLCRKLEAWASSADQPES